MSVTYVDKMPFDKFIALVTLNSSRDAMIPLIHLQLQDGTGAEALSWCRALASCLALVGITSNVYKDSIRFLDPIKEESMVLIKLDSQQEGTLNQVVIEHSNSSPGNCRPGKFLRTSWCSPFEAALHTLVSL